MSMTALRTVKSNHCPSSTPSRKAHGFSLLELLVSIILISLCTAILLDRLRYYQEAAEKANVEYTISMLKSALRVQMATMMVEGRVRDYALLEQQNPMDWLEEKPHNFRILGRTDVDRRFPGYWCFDPIDRTLIYWPMRGDYLQADKSGQKRVRLQVRVVRDVSSPISDVNGGKPIINVVMGPIEE